MKITKAIATAGMVFFMSSPLAVAQDHPMGFFITSVGMGQGANLGGLEGADAYCTKLAEAAGTTGRTWRAYLSTQEEGKRGISARSRIGLGPWYNANGVLIASDLDELHLSPNIVLRTALDENGNRVKGRGDQPNEHDILTGSMADGTAYFPRDTDDHTCSNWTSAGEGSARSDTMTGTAAATRRGTPRMVQEDVVRKICKAPAAPGCSIASPRIRSNPRFQKHPADPLNVQTPANVRIGIRADIGRRRPV